jgi:hypothetical protein
MQGTRCEWIGLGPAMVDFLWLTTLSCFPRPSLIHPHINIISYSVTLSLMSGYYSLDECL